VFVDKLKSWDFRVGAVYLMDSQFLVERGKYISGTMAALSCMTKLEVPHMNIMTKIDVLRNGLKEFKRSMTKSAYLIIKVISLCSLTSCIVIFDKDSTLGLESRRLLMLRSLLLIISHFKS